MRIANQLVSSWSISANNVSDMGPATSTSSGSGSVRYRRACTALVCVGGILDKDVGWNELIYAPRRERLNTQTLPAGEVKLGPLRFRERPICGRAPTVFADHPELHWWFAHDASVDPAQPVIEPLQHLAMEGMERPLEVSGPGEHQLLGRIDRSEIVLRAIQMGLVCVPIPARARVKRDLDVRQIAFGAFSGAGLLVRIN